MNATRLPNGIVQANVPARQAEIPDQINDLRRAVSATSETMTVLLQRLAPVVRPTMAVANLDGSMPAMPPMQTVLGNDLAEVIHRVRGMESELQSTLARLELE